jgi:hypothetical protein
LLFRSSLGKTSALLDQDSGAALPPEPEDVRRLAQMTFADLGWQSLRNDPSARASLPPVDANLTFAHPDLGVALVDMAPASSSNPVERLRRRLEALAAEPVLAAELPIVYLPLKAHDLWRLNIILDSAFSSPLPEDRKESGWVDLVQRALLPESFPAAPVERDIAPPALADSIGTAVVDRPGSGRWIRLSVAAGLSVALLAGVAAIHGFDLPGSSAPPPVLPDSGKAAPLRGGETPPPTPAPSMPHGAPVPPSPSTGAPASRQGGAPEQALTQPRGSGTVAAAPPAAVKAAATARGQLSPGRCGSWCTILPAVVARWRQDWCEPRRRPRMRWSSVPSVPRLASRWCDTSCRRIRRRRRGWRRG